MRAADTELPGEPGSELTSREANPPARRPLRRRWGAVASGAASGALLLAACGSAGHSSAAAATNGTSAAPESITLWESHNGGPVGGAMTALVNRFNAGHKSVHVTIVVTKASKKLLAAIPTGTAPVLAEISHYDGALVKAGALVSWNQFMGAGNTVTKANFTPAVWSNGEVSGQHYRLQADVKVSQVLYNKTLFSQAGITSAPTTWTQLATDAAAIRARDPGVIPLGWKDSSAHILPAFLSDGGSLLQGSNSVGKSVAFDNQAGTTSFSYFRSLYSSGEMQLHHGTTLREDFGAGKMAMIDGTSAGYAKALAAVNGKFQVGAFVEPAGSTGNAYNIDQGLGFVLPKDHTHAQDEAAWTFVQWWYQPAQQVYWAEQTGFAPETRAAIAAMPRSFLSTHPGMVATIAAVKSPYTLPRPVSDSYKEVQAALDTAWFDAVTGKDPVSGTLSTLQSQGNGYMSGASEL